MSQYEQFFADADKDKSGYLTLDEITRLIRSKGYKQTDEDIKAMFGSVDMSGDNKISKEEFLSAMGQVPSKNHKEASMRATFRQFDVDGSGSIDASELHNVLKQCGSDLTEAEVSRLVQLIDKDGSGHITYEEFIAHAFGK